MKYLTSRKLKEIREELTELRKKRNEISERIHEAQDMGDLSENAEYHAARHTDGDANVRRACTRDTAPVP